jgi:hypothetical protein
MRLSQYLRYVSNLFLCFVFSFISFSANAVDIITKPVGLYSTYYFTDQYTIFEYFPTIDAAIDFYNQKQKDSYNRCVARVDSGFCAYAVVKKPVWYYQNPIRDGVYDVTYFKADRVYSVTNQRDKPETDVNFTDARFGHGLYCPDGFTLQYKYQAPDYSVMTGAYCIKKSLC